MLSSLALVAAAAAIAQVAAQLDTLRGTIPGSLHQCENTNMFFFDSSNSRPLTVLFLPSGDVPASLRTGTHSIEDAVAVGPLQVIEGIDTPDAAQYEFTLGLEAGTAFEVFAFLEDGQGKALSLTRTVTTALPGATSCLPDVQTTVAGVAAAAATTTTSSSSSSSSSSSRASSSSSESSAAARSTSSTSSMARSTSTSTGTVTATGASGTGGSAAAAASGSPTGAASSNAVSAMSAVAAMMVSIGAMLIMA